MELERFTPEPVHQNQRFTPKPERNASPPCHPSFVPGDRMTHAFGSRTIGSRALPRRRAFRTSSRVLSWRDKVRPVSTCAADEGNGADNPLPFPSSAERTVLQFFSARLHLTELGRYCSAPVSSSRTPSRHDDLRQDARSPAPARWPPSGARIRWTRANANGAR
jgi:hypothetical protein